MQKIIVITSGKGGVGKSLGYSEYVALANGNVIQIGPYIDNLLENNKTAIKQLLIQTTRGTEIFEVLEPPKNLILNIVKNPLNNLSSEMNKPIALMRKPAPKTLIRITTSNGPIEVTEEHKFLVLRGAQFKKIRADELNEKDYLLEFNYPVIKREYESSSEEVAKLLGYIIGDGYIEKRGSRFLIHVFSEEKNKEIIENIFTKVFGGFKTCVDKRTKVVRTSYFKTQKIKWLFKEYGLSQKKAEKKEIPSKIFKSSINICSAFLASLFDCDGHVCKNRNEIQYDTKSERLAYQVSNLLRTRFKIKSQFKIEYKKASNGKKEKQKYFRIIISGEDIVKFNSQIRFNIQDKRERLQQKINSSFNTNIKLFPAGKLIRIVRESAGLTAKQIADILGCSKQMIYEYEWGLYALSSNSLKRFLQTFKDLNISNEELDFLEKILNDGYSFRKINKIEKIEYNHPYVYDFQVCEEGGHFTHGTGIVVSNTTTAVNLGAAINYFGKNALIIDGNLSTPNVGLHLGSPNAPINLNHVLTEKAEPFEAVYEHESGLKIMPSSISIKELKRIKPERLKDFKKDFSKLSDYIIVDSAAGLGNEAMSAIKMADELIIVTNPEMPAITDALKVIKLAEEMSKPILGVIITRVKKNILEMQPDSVKEMLEIPILGMIPEDITIQKSLSEKDAVVHTDPKSKAARAYKEIAAKLLDTDYDSDKDKPSLWEKLFRKY